ncbi:MAG: TrmH family RNA methyltransferase [Bdellovibrionota bacterium]
MQKIRSGVTARSALEFVKLTEFIELKAAITDCNVAYGFSARDSFNRHARLSLQQATQQIKVENNLRTAAIFGPEATGLRKEHLDLCTQLVRIPSSTNFESFNLAQSTLLFMYELIRTQNDVLQESSGDDTATVNATINDLLQIEKLVDESARLSGFYGKGTPSHIPSVIHNLIKRTMPTENEASVLLGLFSKIRKALLGEIPINNE